MDVFLLGVGLVVILVACEGFTNAVEWLGKRLGWHQGAVGSVLAAVGTALPETIVPILAILFHRGAGERDVGIGAILGAPLMLSCLTLPLVGAVAVILAVRGRRPFVIEADQNFFRNDLAFFLVSYGLAVGAAAIPWRGARYAVAAALIGVYVVYVLRRLRAKGESNETHRPLYFEGHAAKGGRAPSTSRIVGQLAAALIVMVAGANLFVDALVRLSAAWGISALVLSILLTPFATELPEKFNSILWMSRRKDTLAVGNVTGAMVFQSTFPVSVGLLGTPWELHGRALLAAGVTLTAAGVLLVESLLLRQIHPLLFVANGAFFVGYAARALSPA